MGVESAGILEPMAVLSELAEIRIKRRIDFQFFVQKRASRQAIKDHKHDGRLIPMISCLDRFRLNVEQQLSYLWVGEEEQRKGGYDVE